MLAYAPILLKMPLFAGVAAGDLSLLANCLSFRVKKYLQNEAVFLEGSKITRIGIVLSGIALVLKEDLAGNRMIFSEIKTGQVFGEAIAFSRSQISTVSIFAAEDSEILTIDSRNLSTICQNNCPFHNQLIRNMLQTIAEKNIMQKEKIELLSKRSIRAKILNYLRNESRKNFASEFRISLNRQELADYLCVDRSALSAELGKLQKEGLLCFRKNDFKLNFPTETVEL